MYCLPVLKRETHRLDLVKAATSGNPKFFLGTDTAPHAREAKLSACGKAHACGLAGLLSILWCSFLRCGPSEDGHGLEDVHGSCGG